MHVIMMLSSTTSSSRMALSISARAIRIPARGYSRCLPKRDTHLYQTLCNSTQVVRVKARSVHNPWMVISKRWATSVTPHSTASDPAEWEALRCLEQGTAKLEEGDVEAARSFYERSVEIKRTASSLFNLGVTHYHLKQYDEAISAWKESITLQPSSPDAHTNLASAYIVSPIPRPDLAIHHLQLASSLAPEDPEIAFNLAVVLEAIGRLEDALAQYKRSKEFGVERAALHIRNVSAKILGQRMKATEESES